MRIILESLLALQKLELEPGDASPSRDQQIMEVRGRIPERLLAHYDLLLADGRKGVALIRDGTCSQCRQSVVASALNAFTHGHPIQICIHCQAFLYWPDDETNRQPAAAPRSCPAQRRSNSPVHV